MPLSWDRYFNKDNRYDIHLERDPGNRRLSKHDIGTLSKVIDLHRDHDEWDLVEIAHQLPEWQKNDPGESSRPIPIEDILAAVDRSEDTEAIIDDAETSAAFDQFFRTHHGR